MTSERNGHWEKVYSSKDDDQLSWHQDSPIVSLEFCQRAGASSSTSFIDIGAGTSSLVDALAKKGMVDLTVLDISVGALAKAKLAMGDRASMVNWLHEDIVEWKPSRTYALWHDRAVFHFLVEENDRRAYLSCLNQALHVGGHAIIATFALDGPDKCSGLPVQKYSSAKLSDVLGPDFELIADKNIAHKTPWGSSQAFQYSLFKKIY